VDQWIKNNVVYISVTLQLFDMIFFFYFMMNFDFFSHVSDPGQQSASAPASHKTGKQRLLY
jgi:hypothetical protein